MSNVHTFRRPTEPGANEAINRQDIVDSLHTSLEDGIRGAKMVPIYVQYAFEHEVWKKPRTLAAGSTVEAITFAQFVHEPYPVGLGSDYKTVRQFLGRGSAALAMWDAATKREAGGANNPSGLGGKSGKAKAIVTFDNIQGDNPEKPKAPTGTSAQAAIRRLSRDADAGDTKAADLLVRVTDGEMKPHAAAVEMGYRPKTITVREDVAALFAALMKTATAPEIALMAIKACDDEGLRTIFAGLADVLMARR